MQASEPQREPSDHRNEWSLGLGSAGCGAGLSSSQAALSGSAPPRPLEGGHRGEGDAAQVGVSAWVAVGRPPKR